MLRVDSVLNNDAASVGLFIGPWTPGNAVLVSQREALRRRYMMLSDTVSTTSSHGTTTLFTACASMSCNMCLLTVSSTCIQLC